MKNIIIDRNSPIWHYLALIVIILSAYLIFSDLRHESIWFDEGYTYAVSRLPLDRIVIPFDVHPPLFYVIESFFVRDGANETWLRLPAALAGIVCVIMVYIVANDFFGSRGAFASTTFIGLSFALITYSSNARNYTLLLLLFMAACYSLAKIFYYCVNDSWSGKKSNKFLIMYFLSAVACLYTHNISIIYLAVLNVTVLFFSALHLHVLKRKYIAGYAILNVCIFICWIPWLSVLIGTTGEFDWLKQPSIGLTIKQFLAILRPNHTSLWIAVPYLLGLATIFIYTLIKSDDYFKIIVLTTIIGIPLSVFGIGYIKPLYMERTILPVLLGFALCFGFFVSNIHKSAISAAIIGFVTISSVIFAFNYHNRIPTDETVAGKLSQDWRTAISSDDINEIFIADHLSIPTVSFYLKEKQKIYLYDNEQMFPVTLDKWNEYFSQPIKYRRANDSIKFADFIRMNEENEPYNQQVLRNKSITLIEIKIINQSKAVAAVRDFLSRNGYELKETTNLAGLKSYRYILKNE